MKESMIEFLILNMWKYQNETHNHKENDLRWINFESISEAGKEKVH